MSLPVALTRAVMAMESRMSFESAVSVGRKLGLATWLFDGRHRRVAEHNLKIAFPDWTPSRRERVARECFAQIGRTVTELLWSPALDHDSLADVGEVSGLERLAAAVERGRGVLLLSAHFGNWELLGVLLGMLGFPLHVIARRLADPQLEATLDELRTRTGNRVIHKENAVREAMRTLRGGGIVGVLIDQNTLRSYATFVPFFGVPAATSALLGQLHARSGAPIVPGLAVPTRTGYRFIIEQPLTADGDDVAESATQAATALLEQYIKRHPQAWLWIHDRWRTRPE